MTLPSHDVITICKIAETVIRSTLYESEKYLSNQMIEAFLLQQVLHRLNENNIVFHNLEEHSYYQTALQNHVVHLMRGVASKYIQIRLYFIGRNITDNENNVSIRQQFNKIVLFKGQ